MNCQHCNEIIDLQTAALDLETNGHTCMRCIEKGIRNGDIIDWRD